MATKASTSLITDAISEIRQSTGAGSTNTTAGESDNSSEVSEWESVSASDSVDDGDEPTPPAAETESTGVDSSESAPASAKAAPEKTGISPTEKPSQKEKITVTDDTGKKTLEIDYNDRAAIKKAFELAHGARKWQGERDKTLASEKQIREKYTADRRILDALEQAYQQRGELGVIDLISGKPGASAEFIQKQVDRAKFLERASPEELEQLQQKEELEQLKRDMARHRTETEQREANATAQREQAELRSLESRVNPAFEKYRFDGKLGDGEDEAMYDELLWNATMKRLSPFEEQGVEITRELVDSTFKDVSSRLRKRIGVTASKQASNIISQKKQEAIENVQANATSAYKKGGARAEAEDLISKGNFKSLFSNWGKHSKAFK